MIHVAMKSPEAPIGKVDLAEKVLAAFKKHERLIGLKDWWITIVWGECPDIMEVTAKPEYYMAEITVDLNDLPLDEIDEHVRHELLHILIWMYTSIAEEMSGEGKDTLRKLEERMVSDLERMPLWQELPPSYLIDPSEWIPIVGSTKPNSTDVPEMKPLDNGLFALGGNSA